MAQWRNTRLEATRLRYRRQHTWIPRNILPCWNTFLAPRRTENNTTVYCTISSKHRCHSTTSVSAIRFRILW